MVGDGRRAGHPRDGAVGDRAGELEHLRPERGQEHGRWRRRALHVDRGTSGDRLARRRDLAVAQERHEHVEVLADVAQRLVERQPEHALDHQLVREADAEDEPAAADGLRGERLLGQRDRVTRVRRDDRRAELDARHLAAHDREGHERVHPEDLGEPEGREPVVGGSARRVDGGVDRSVGGVSGEDPDAHARQAKRSRGCADRPEPVDTFGRDVTARAGRRPGRDPPLEAVLPGDRMGRRAPRGAAAPGSGRPRRSDRCSASRRSCSRTAAPSARPSPRWSWMRSATPSSRSTSCGRASGRRSPGCSAGAQRNAPMPAAVSPGSQPRTTQSVRRVLAADTLRELRELVADLRRAGQHHVRPVQQPARGPARPLPGARRCAHAP